MKKLTQLRLKKEVTQEELGKAIGVSEKTISTYETGRRNLPVDKAKKIGDYFQVNWWELYEDERGWLLLRR